MTTDRVVLQWREYLEPRYELYCRSGFIPSDPVSVPHRFSSRADIETAAFLTATISWGNRRAILKSANLLFDLMDNAPGDFVANAADSDLMRLEGYVYRTFQTIDLLYFITALQRIYRQFGNLEEAFSMGYCPEKEFGMVNAIGSFRQLFFDDAAVPCRTRKHLPDVEKGAAAKRINMFLRWMVRADSSGVDFGMWKKLPPSALLCPLDVHSGRVARKIGLLTRRQDDLKAVIELTTNLRRLDRDDPVRYDYALFGEGVNKR